MELGVHGQRWQRSPTEYEAKRWAKIILDVCTGPSGDGWVPVSVCLQNTSLDQTKSHPEGLEGVVSIVHTGALTGPVTVIQKMKFQGAQASGSSHRGLPP